MKEKSLIGIQAIPSKDVKLIVDALKRHGDPKVVRREIAKEMRAALKPSVAQAKAGIMSMHSGSSHGGAPLRSAIARKTSVQIRLTARRTGVTVRVAKTPAIRGFALAGRYTNRKKWRHQVFGSDDWVDQRGKPGWFDDAMSKGRSDQNKAVRTALETITKRIVGA